MPGSALERLASWAQAGAGIALGLIVLALLAALFSLALRRANPAHRHLLWMVVLLSGIVLPAGRLTAPLLTIRLPANSTAEQGTPETIRLEHQPVQAAHRSPASAVPWSTALAALAILLWMGGALVALAARTRSARVAHEIRSRSATMDDARWQRDLAWLQRRLNLSGPVELLLSAETDIPFATGILHPAIVLPDQAGAWPALRRRAVLAHELAHLARRDVLLRLGATVARALHWWNPVMVIAGRRAHAESERAADALALSCGLRPSSYAAVLLGFSGFSGPALGVAFARRSTLRERVHAILAPASCGPAPRHGVRTGTLALTAILLLANIRTMPTTAPMNNVAETGSFLGSIPPVQEPSGTVPRPESVARHGPPARAASSPVTAAPLDSSDIVGALLDALRDPNAQVRAAALRSLANIGDRRALDPVSALLSDGDPFVRKEAERTRASLQP